MPRRVYPNLREFFRINRDVTAQRVADDVGISYPFMSMIKWGERQPRLEVALRIAERCSVPLESLVRVEAGHKKAS